MNIQPLALSRRALTHISLFGLSLWYNHTGIIPIATGTSPASVTLQIALHTLATGCSVFFSLASDFACWPFPLSVFTSSDFQLYHAWSYGGCFLLQM